MSIKKIAAIMASEYNVAFTPEKAALWRNGLHGFDDLTIERAIYSYIQDPKKSSFAPKLGDIMGLCAAISGAPTWIGADEAWAQVPTTEDQSAMLTNEAAEALAGVQELIARRDLIAARMAFKDAYERLVERAKAEGRMPRYFFSAGRDQASRAACLTAAVQKRLIAPEAVAALLPPDQVEQVLLAGGVPRSHPLLAPPAPANRAKVKELLALLKPQQTA